MTKEIVVSDPLLDGIESLLTILLTEAKANEREMTDDEGKVITMPAVSFEERLKLVATCTKFLESKVKLVPPPPEKPSDFEEMMNGKNGTPIGEGNTGEKAKAKRGRPPRNRLPESQFDPDNGRVGGAILQSDDGSTGHASNGHAAASPFWGDAGDDAGNAGNA